MFELKDTASNHPIHLPFKENFKDDTFNYSNLSIDNSLLQFMLSGIEDVVWYWDQRETSIRLSARWLQWTGYESSTVDTSGEKWRPLIHPEDQDAVKNYFRSFQNDQSQASSGEFRICLQNGLYQWVSCYSSGSYDAEGCLLRMVGSLKDISQQKSMEIQLRHLHDYDQITELHSYKYTVSKLDSVLKSRQKGTVLLVDIDGFSKLKGTYGILTGNELLRVVSNLLKGRIRESDLLSRFDEDKFIILLSNSTGKRKAENVAQRILEIFHYPFEIFNQKLYVTASVGIVFLPSDCDNVFDLIKHGNSAIYAAREYGPNRFELYKESTSNYVQKLNIENELRNAVEKNEFLLYYQPIVQRTGRLTGVEALIRWNHPEKGVLLPNDFIPVAEAGEIIVAIGNRVLNAACIQNKRWQDLGYPAICTAVNISARQLQKDDFVDSVLNALSNSGLSPEYLELELTESVLVESMNKTAKKLEYLRNLGVKVALDDFGSGYSSLNYLKSLPIDKIKIDRSFINDINKNSKVEAIISAIITLSQKMHLELVAEGVENTEQLDFLTEMGCNLIQGYIYSRPLPLDEIEEILRRSEISIDEVNYNYYQI